MKNIIYITKQDIGSNKLWSSYFYGIYDELIENFDKKINFYGETSFQFLEYSNM